MKYPAYRIETERLVLRCYHPEDAPLLKEAIDKSIDHLRPWMPWSLDEPTEIEEKIELLRGFRANFDLSKDFFYGIFDKEEKRLIGSTGLHTRIGKCAYEIGYWIAKDFIGNGYATEASRALLKAGFEVEGIDRIEIHMNPANTASIKVPKKLGFTLETIRKRTDVTFEKEFRDSMIWILYRSEYEKMRNLISVRMYDAVGKEIADGPGTT
ncbi:MAG: N-acetyltransferase [Spirochaetae bacterium HGW-Spirochaetae-10]|nr:MAG: N-acetyltransferase [Spirochaetae bacterium HGW-Spirochaetae-10]